MLSDYDTVDFKRLCAIGGLSASIYFLTVFLCMPSSRAIPRIDRPLHSCVNLVGASLRSFRLPLPQGEGWGEGENITYLPDTVSTLALRLPHRSPPRRLKWRGFSRAKRHVPAISSSTIPVVGVVGDLHVKLRKRV